MTIKKNAVVALGSILAVAFGLAMWNPAVSQPERPKTDSAKMDKANKDHAKMAGCQAIVDQRTKLSADLKKEDAELTAHAAKMNNAPDDEKVDEIAALLTHVIEQRTSTNARMASMDAAKTRHMSQHHANVKGGMANCPMLDGIGAMEVVDDASWTKQK